MAKAGKQGPRPRKKRVRQADVVRRFGERLRELRRSVGLSQEELARRAGVASAYVGRLERGLAAPGIDLVDRLVQALGTTIPDLFPTAATAADPTPLLQEQARKSFEDLLEMGDRPTLSMLNLLLAHLRDSVARGR
jgi:transcriptional regulator with XRE-family HTH domain